MSERNFFAAERPTGTLRTGAGIVSLLAGGGDAPSVGKRYRSRGVGHNAHHRSAGERLPNQRSDRRDKNEQCKHKPAKLG